MRLARAQRLTGRVTALGRAEARSAVRGRGVPGGSHVRPTRTTEPGSRDDRPHTGATSLQTCLVFSAPRPRPSKSPSIHRKNSGLRPTDPGVRSSAGLGGGGGSLQRTRLAAMSPRTPDPNSGPVHLTRPIWSGIVTSNNETQSHYCPGAAGTPCTQPFRDVASQNNGGETDAVSGT